MPVPYYTLATNMFIPQVFVERLPCDRHCSRHWLVNNYSDVSSVEWKPRKGLACWPLCLKLSTPVRSLSLRRRAVGVSCPSVGLGVSVLWQKPSLRAEGDCPSLLYLCRCDWMELEDTMLSEVNPSQNTRRNITTIWFHSLEVFSQIHRHKKVEWWLSVAGRDWELGKYCLMGTKF